MARPRSDIQIDGGNLDEVEMPQMDQEPMSESLVGKTPPASLKTLVLEVPHYRSPFNHIKWLQHPQGDYNPQNLFLRFNEDCEPMYAIEWSMMWKDTALSPSPSLENVRLEFPDPCNQDNGDEIDVGPSVRKAISRLVMAQLTGARTLHAAPIFLDAPFPSTLEDLRIVFESTSRSEPEWAHEVAWGRRDSALEDLIRGLKSRGAHRKIVVTVTEEGDDEGYFDERDYDDIEDYLGCTIEFCGDNGIELYKAEEKDVGDVSTIFSYMAKCSSKLILRSLNRQWALTALKFCAEQNLIDVEESDSSISGGGDILILSQAPGNPNREVDEDEWNGR